MKDYFNLSGNALDIFRALKKADPGEYPKLQKTIEEDYEKDLMTVDETSSSVPTCAPRLRLTLSTHVVK